MTSSARLVILGKQGAGKGTQCARLARHYVVPHVSTGEIFRNLQNAGTPAAEEVHRILDAGELVPDELTVQVVRDRLSQDDALHRGFILDGFPRTTFQAEALAEMLSPADLDLAIDIEVPTEVVLRRLAGRRVCSDCQTNYGPGSPPKLGTICDVCGGEVEQRPDDTELAIRRRLSIYEEQTEPIITWYLGRDKLVTIDGMGTPDDVTSRLTRAIDSRGSHGSPRLLSGIGESPAMAVKDLK